MERGAQAPLSMPFRIEMTAQCVASVETLKRNAEANEHYPKLQPSPPTGRKLAIVGGGPLVAYDLPELKAWDGDIWAVNYTVNWLHEHGIKATFTTVDPGEFGEIHAERAIVASGCSPTLLAKLKNVQTFDMIETHANGLPGGVFTGTRLPLVALTAGYLDVSFFGFEGSYAESSHVDRHESANERLIVRAGKDYMTEPSFVMQCQEFVELFTHFGVVFKNRSGGLLKAMQEHPETWEIVAVSAGMKAHLEQINGASGLYDAPYP